MHPTGSASCFVDGGEYLIVVDGFFAQVSPESASPPLRNGALIQRHATERQFMERIHVRTAS